jgi:NTP pyrophosphatase (non-canonical NTP hydrolase)
MTAGNFSIGSPVWSGMSKLIEECGEVLQLAGKLIATGGAVEHWDGSNLRERLIEELADLAAAVTYFTQTNGLETQEFHDRRRAKVELFKKWETEQKP